MHRSVRVARRSRRFGRSDATESTGHTWRLATNGSTEPSFGVMRAAAIVPMPDTSISSGSAPSDTGPICLNHSTSTRSERRTTIGHRSNSPYQPRPCHQSEFHECESHALRADQCPGGRHALPGREHVASRTRAHDVVRAEGRPPASNAMSASMLQSSWRHGSRRLAMFQLTTFMANSSSDQPPASRVLLFSLSTNAPVLNDADSPVETPIAPHC